MTNKKGYFLLLVLVGWSVVACKKKVEAEYEKALEDGVLLVEGDTVQVPLHQSILFNFSFADGVNPLHYTWDIYQWDSSKFRYLDTKEFHFAELGIVGGPAAGIHQYEALEEGWYTLVFYNPYYNEEQFQKQQETEDPFLIWKAFKEAFASYDSLTDWNRTAFEQHWLALEDAEAHEEADHWQEFYQQTYTTDSLPDSTTMSLLLNSWAKEYTPFHHSAAMMELLDSLLGAEQMPYRQTWKDLRQSPTMPLHPNTNTQTYYVHVITK